MDDQGIKSLIAAVLKQAFEDYQNPNRCPGWCPMEDCTKRQVDKYTCEVLKFIRSAWCSALCDGIDISQRNMHKLLRVAEKSISRLLDTSKKFCAIINRPLSNTRN